jgi:isoleucyl-tRNA synthetase
VGRSRSRKSARLQGKPDILAYGLENFSRACRERVDKFAVTITEQSKRLGQWMDWERSYYTFDDSNIEHIWLFLKKCHEEGWLAQITASCRGVRAAKPA